MSDKIGFVKKIKSKNRKLFVWTVDDPKEIKKCIEMGDIDAILSNDPVKCIIAKRNFVKKRKIWMLSILISVSYWLLNRNFVKRRKSWMLIILVTIFCLLPNILY